MSLHIATMSSPSQELLLKPSFNPLYATSKPLLTHTTKHHVSLSRTTTRAILSSTKEVVMKEFRHQRALKIISGLHNFDKENVASVVTAADKGGATHVDIACDPELVKLAVSLTSLPICVSSVDPSAFLAAVEAGATMVEIGNYDSFYDTGRLFSPDEAKLAELLQDEGADIIQTEGGKCSNPTKAGVLGLLEKATPTLAAAYTISRAVKIPVMCASGLSAVTVPLAITAGAAGVGVGSAVNKLNDVVAMIAEVRSLADALASQKEANVDQEKTLKWL
ncbi:hypothetical protein KSS87_009355 [Heliosperma pusillum]|nr:hypothetical protein KSS87_009355 [Heliosperma pusillum]